MTSKEILEALQGAFPDAVLGAKIDGVFDPFITIAPHAICDVARFLRDTPATRFDSLMCLSGIDYTKGKLGVVYP